MSFPRFLRATPRTTSRVRGMSTRVVLPHEERTAAEPRGSEMHAMVLDKIEIVNESIRLYRLRIRDQKKGLKFLPGQWIDLHIPTLPKAGGFTMTSLPTSAAPDHPPPYIELAVQKSPDNPPAAWLWRDASSILGTHLQVRVGGSFVWPPFGWSKERIREIETVLMVAGGVGINPLMSMVSHMHSTQTMPKIVKFLYSTKKADQTLFLERLRDIEGARGGQFELGVFFTSGDAVEREGSSRRIQEKDLLDALGIELDVRGKTLCYVCGPPSFTDWVVELLKRQEGMAEDRVLCEKWW